MVSAGDKPISRNYRPFFPDVPRPEGSIFSPTPSNVEVYICSIVENSIKQSDVSWTIGEVQLKVEKSLTGGEAKVLRLPFWIPNMISEDLMLPSAEERKASAIWPVLAPMKAEDRLLIALDRSKENLKDGFDGRVTDVIELHGPDDPIIEQVQRIITLRDTKPLDELKQKCWQILEARAGRLAMQAVALTALERIAPSDPEGAMKLIVMRLASCPNDISREELDRILTFIESSIDNPKLDVGGSIFDRLLLLLITFSEEKKLPMRAGPYGPLIQPPPPLKPKVVHVFAKLVKRWNFGISDQHRAALNGLLQDLQKEASYSAVFQNAETIKKWLSTAPRWSIDDIQRE